MKHDDMNKKLAIILYVFWVALIYFAIQHCQNNWWGIQDSPFFGLYKILIIFNVMSAVIVFFKGVVFLSQDDDDEGPNNNIYGFDW